MTNPTRLTLFAALTLGLTACGGPAPQETGEASDDLTIVGFGGPTCVNVIELMQPTFSEVPLVDVSMTGGIRLPRGSLSDAFVDATSSRLSTFERGTYHLAPADVQVILRKRTQTLGGRTYPIGALLELSFFDATTGATRYDVNLVPTSCTVNNGIGTVMATGPSGETIQLTYFKLPFG